MAVAYNFVLRLVLEDEKTKDQAIALIKQAFETQTGQNFGAEWHELVGGTSMQGQDGRAIIWPASGHRWDGPARI